MRGTAPLNRLGLAGRLLLTSDGTVTPMLEQIVGERIVTARLNHTEGCVDPEDRRLLSAGDGGLTTRLSQLIGEETGTVYVRARSTLALAAIPPAFRADLLGTEEPIGRLLRRHRIESFREIVSLEVAEDTDGVAEHSRRYLVFTGGTPGLLIEETFTAACFDRGR